MDKLLTCAHCGCSEIAEWEDDESIYHIACEGCSESVFETSRELAVIEWNRRPDPWTRVEDGSPKSGAQVLIRCKGGAQFVATFRRLRLDDSILWIVEGGPLGTGGQIDPRRVTHWMLLPAPPEKRRKGAI